MENHDLSLFIDGIIFGERVFGGVARIWEAIIPRLAEREIPLTLLFPARKHHPLEALPHQHESTRIIYDHFYWPKRFFGDSRFRSSLLTNLYHASDAKIFHTSYFTTLHSPGTRKFVTVYDLIYEIYESRAPSKWVRQVLENKRNAIESADQIICISESTKRDLLRLYSPSLEPKVAVIYSGVAPFSGKGPIRPFRDLADRNGLILRGNDYFLVVGGLDGYKNFKLILDLLDQKPADRDYRFLSVGAGKNSSVREEALRKYPANFVFLDFVPNEDLAVLYQNAIGLVYSSLYEGFGLPVIEAMQNLCPVACSNSSSLPEAGGEAAIYFDPRSTDELHHALIRLATCDRLQVTEKGLLQSRKFSWEKTVDDLLNLYKSML
jgi:mannosyltransferase